MAMAPTHRQIIVYNFGAAIFFLLIIATVFFFERATSHPPIYIGQWTFEDSRRLVESFTDLGELKRYTLLQVELRDTEREVTKSLFGRLRDTTLWLCAISSGLFLIGAGLTYFSLRRGGSNLNVRSNL
jgi:uncharacterized membrane protein YbhN (UPF0104 family)